jgi:hypothetical protein
MNIDPNQNEMTLQPSNALAVEVSEDDGSPAQPTLKALQDAGLAPKAEAQESSKADELAALRAELKEQREAQAQQVAELTNLIKAQSTAKAQPTQTAEEFEAELLTEILTSPSAAIERIIAQRETKAQADKVAREAAISDANARLVKLAPDVSKLKADPALGKEFQAYIDADPTRKDAMARSAQTMDIETRALMVRSFFENKEARGSLESSIPDNAAAKALAQAAGSPNSQSANQATGKEVFSRSALQRLAQTDPSRYQALGPAIRLAYIENRIVE